VGEGKGKGKEERGRGGSLEEQSMVWWGC